MMSVHPSGYYAWCETPLSQRALEDERLLGHIKHSWLESGAIYGYRKVTDDLRELGEACSKNRVYRLMKLERLRSQTGYHRRPGARGGLVAVVAPNHLQRQFDVAAPNRVWVTDITYILTHEGWLFLAAVLDLFSRQVIGWSMGPRMDRELALMPCLWPSGAGSPNKQSWCIRTREVNSAATTGRHFSRRTIYSRA
jgi:putative transposase